MNSRSSRFHLAANRTSAIAVVTAVIASLAATLTATPAGALPPVTNYVASMTPTSPVVSYPATPSPSIATVSADFLTSAPYDSATQTLPPIGYAVESGSTPGQPNVNNFDTADCSVTPPADGQTKGHVDCAISDAAGPGTDAVQIIAHNSASAPSQTDVSTGNITLQFTGNPSSVTLVPVTSQVPVGTCELFTLSSSDTQGRPAGHQPFTISIVENTTNPTAITRYDNTCENAPTTVGVSATTATTTTYSFPITTGDDGSAVFGIASSVVGSGGISAVATANSVGNATPVTVAWTAGGPNAVTTLTLTPPANVTQYTNTSVTYTLTATDSSGDSSGSPVQNVPVYEQVTDGPEAGSKTLCSSASDPTGVTNHLGVVKCTVTSNAAHGTGTDDITFWVDQTSVPPSPDPYPTEPQARGSATFRAQPTFDHSSLTCIDELATDANHPSTSCVVPTSQHSVTFTETLTNAGAPVVGAEIEFNSVQHFGGTTTVPTPTFATTDANGVATYSVSDPGAAAGDYVNVQAFLGTQLLNSPPVTTATWATPQETTLTLTPNLQSATRGSLVTVTAQLTDQFGAPWTGAATGTYGVSGADSASGTFTTTGSGSAVISFQTGASTVLPTDTVQASVNGGPTASPATVKLVTGSTSAATVAVDTSGNGTSAVCPASGTPQNTNLILGVSNTEVCALVKNSNNETLAGKSVTFTVDIGQVAGSNATAATTKTYVTSTNAQGIAVAFVASTTSGTQTVTATSDGASGSGTLSYALPSLDKARNITVSPTSAAIVAGNSQKFTWKVVDQFANPVAGVTLTYIQAGAGLSGATSSGTLLTGPDGTASVVVSTSTTDSGAGSITATIQQPSAPSPLNQCTQPKGTPSTSVTAGNCTAAATYTVVTGSPPAHVALTTTQVTKGHQEVVTAKVTNGDGTPSANQVVRFLVTGANGLIGSAQTNASGVAIFSYPAKHAGVDRISAFVDINNDTLQESNEPGKHTKVIVGGIKEHPTMFLTTKHRSVTIHVRTHPVLPRAVVKYYVKRYGKFHKIGTSHAGLLGKASMKFFFPKGVVRTFKAKVIGNQGIKGGKTKKKTIRIR